MNDVGQFLVLTDLLFLVWSNGQIICLCLIGQFVFLSCYSSICILDFSLLHIYDLQIISLTLSFVFSFY